MEQVAKVCRCDTLMSMSSVPVAQHELKIWPQFFDAWANGEKRAEIRLNDRNYKVGEWIVLREFKKGRAKKPYTGRILKTKIIHITKLSDVPGTHKDDANFVVLSLIPLKPSRISPSEK